MKRNLKRLASLVWAVAVLSGPARAGDLHEGTRGAALYPGNVPRASPYDGPVPGWRPAGRGDAGPGYPTYHPSHRPSGPSIPGLWRYPFFHGYIPPAPHDDCLYQTGKHPWRRG